MSDQRMAHSSQGRIPVSLWTRTMSAVFGTMCSTVFSTVASSTGRTGTRSGAEVRPRFTPLTCVSSALTVAVMSASSRAQASMYLTRHSRVFRHER